MKPTMRISLKANERLFVNGAVLRVDRKTSIELLNNVSFLLEDHVMQADEAETPLQRLYFILQMMIIEPESRNKYDLLYLELHRSLMASSNNLGLQEALIVVDREVQSGRIFEGMKIIRELFNKESSSCGKAEETLAPTG